MFQVVKYSPGAAWNMNIICHSNKQTALGQACVTALSQFHNIHESDLASSNLTASKSISSEPERISAESTKFRNHEQNTTGKTQNNVANTRFHQICPLTKATAGSRGKLASQQLWSISCEWGFEVKEFSTVDFLVFPRSQEIDH